MATRLSGGALRTARNSSQSWPWRPRYARKQGVGGRPRASALAYARTKRKLLCHRGGAAVRDVLSLEEVPPSLISRTALWFLLHKQPPRYKACSSTSVDRERRQRGV